MRTAAGILLGVAFFALLVWVTMQQVGARCDVCMVHRGRQVCESARAADRDHAIVQARNAACAQISAGVTDGIQCNGTTPLSIRCSEDE